VRARELERRHFDSAEGARQARLQERLLAALEFDAVPGGLRRDGVVADTLQRPDRRNVERELERLADEDGTTVKLIGFGGDPLGAELRGDVQQQAARRQAALAERR